MAEGLIVGANHGAGGQNNAALEGFLQVRGPEILHEARGPAEANDDGKVLAPRAVGLGRDDPILHGPEVPPAARLAGPAGAVGAVLLGCVQAVIGYRLGQVAVVAELAEDLRAA